MVSNGALQLTKTDYAHIGYGMVGYSHIERAILVLCITLTEHETKTQCESSFSDSRFQSLLKAGLKDRFKKLLKLYKRNLGDDRECAHLSDVYPILVRSRDCFVHGLWVRISDERLIASYPSRAAIRDGRLQDKLEFTNQELEGHLDLIAGTLIKLEALHRDVERRLKAA